MVRGEVCGGLKAAAWAAAASCCWAAAAATELRSMSFLISDWTRTRCSSFDLSLNSCRISCCVIGLVSPNLRNCCSTRGSSSLEHICHLSNGVPRLS